MLSNKQMRQLIQKVYGASNQYGKEITRLYKRASRQIKAEISAFIQSKANWSGTPSKDVLEEVREQLENLQQDNPVAPLASVYLAPLLDSPVNGDLISAQIALPMIKLAKEQQQRVQKLNNDIPRHLQRANHERNQQAPSRHQIPFDYDNWVHDYVTQNSSQADQVSNTINRNIQQTIDRLTSVIKEAAMSNDASIDYTKKVDRILTGNHIHKGAAGHANTILRTQACHVLNGSTIEDFKVRGIKRYRFMSLETIKSCNRCTNINDKVFEVANAQEGVNLPPMHPNCQCWIVEYEEDEPMISSSEVNDLPMNLQFFGRKKDSDTVKSLIASGEVDEALYNKRKLEFNEMFSNGIVTPIETVRATNDRYEHIIARHHDQMYNEYAIKRVVQTLKEPDEIYKSINRFGQEGHGYFRTYNGQELLVIVRNGFRTAFVPSASYSKKMKKEASIYVSTKPRN